MSEDSISILLLMDKSKRTIARTIKAGGSSLVSHSTNIDRGTRMGSIKCLLICPLLELLSVAHANLQLGFYAKALLGGR